MKKLFWMIPTLTILGFVVIATFLPGCCSPVPRPHYVALLNDCREANMRCAAEIWSYEQQIRHNTDLIGKLCAANRRPVPQALCDDLCNIPQMKIQEDR